MTLARIALERGDVERAEAILEMGIKICDEYQAYIAMPYIYDILASILIATGNIKKAENLLVQIIEKMLQLGVPENDSQIVDFKLRLARIYSSYDENELAEIGFKKCLVVQEAKILDGDTSTKTGMLYVNVLFWYGLHKIKSANYVKAKQLIDSAYNYSMKIRGLTPYQEMVILYTLADLNFQLEDYDIALQNIQSAILLGKGIGSLDLPRCYLKLGKIYIKLSSNDVAKHWLNEAYKLATLFNDSEVLEEVEIILSQLPEKKATFF
ncbi:tetratricopeptide repeat protein 19, mitochondrial-like [Anoplophora glabripennis]|uniref:tetratricopeptide repeat protein 19, mitochondrial-like n=1 Tax=Anoplophora glabripennis TaxID=217634 RepID=UPI000C7924E7|nr:tetratricopeptide repeat protein 19, mitochondrial-like [Anoplophora glabripennis]